MRYNEQYSPIFYGVYPVSYMIYGRPTPLPYTIREYPPVDTGMFAQSITAFQKLMQDGSILLNKLSQSPFAYQLMTAAQAGHKQEVDRLISTIGIGSKISTKYTPSGVLFTIDPNVQGTSCCTLTMALQWGM